MSASSIDIDLDHCDEAEEKRIIRKIDLHLLPLLSLLSLLARLNGGNIANARLGGLEADLDLTTEQYQWCLSAFFAGFVLCQFPSNIILRRWRTSRWLSFVAFCAGLTNITTSTVKSYPALLICRFLLGAFQCGLVPGFMFYTSIWYQKKQQASRFGSVWSMNTLAGAFGGLIAYAIGHIDTPYFSQWQLIFLIEGFPVIIIAVICFVYLPDSPEQAWFLTDKERKFVVVRLAKESGHTKSHSFTWPQVLSIFTDWKSYVYILIKLGGAISLQGVSLFLPTLIHAMGSWTRVEAQLMTIPPYLAAFCSIFIISRSSDRYVERAFHLVATNIISISGFLILIFVDQSHVHIRYCGLLLVTSGLYASVSVRAAWVSNNFASLTRRAIIGAFLGTIGASTGVISSQIYNERQKPQYQMGHTIVLSCVLMQGTVSLILRFILDRINRQRAEMNENEIKETVERYGGNDVIGDRHPNFRYTL